MQIVNQLVYKRIPQTIYLGGLMSAEYTTVMLPDGTSYKSFGWNHPVDPNHVDYYAMSDWHTELVKSVDIDPETGRKTVYTYKPTGQKYIDPVTGEATDKVTCTIGEYDFARAAEYHPLNAGDMVHVEHDGAPFVKIWLCGEDRGGSPRHGIKCSGWGNNPGFIR